MIRRRPRLRTVLLAVNFLVLLLPVAGIVALRLYENELIRSTESQLIVQGAIVREAFRLEYLRIEAGDREPPDTTEAITAGRTEAVSEPTPILPTLNISRERIRPRAADAAPPVMPPDAVAVAAGSRIDHRGSQRE